jgi:hypothetical protein
LRINVNPGSLWNSFSADAFLIANAMRSMSMTDDAYFAELRHSLGLPESNLYLSQGPIASVKPVNHVHKASNYEMVIGPWYLDEFGNPTREIKARD